MCLCLHIKYQSLQVLDMNTDAGVKQSLSSSNSVIRRRSHMTRDTS